MSDLCAPAAERPTASRLRRHAGLIAALLLTFSMLGPAVADTPDGGVAHSIAVVDANGFVAVSETITAEGAVIDTFQSGGTTIKVLGSLGSSASFYPTGPTKDQNGGLGVAITLPGSKTDPLAYSNSGRTVVGDLMAMGVSRADAERLGGLETADGTNPYAAASGFGQSAPNADLAVARAPSVPRSSLLASPTTVWDTQCITASAESGKLYGYGCSTFFIAHQSGTDWYLATKYQFSAHSTDTSLFPKRLKQIGWKVQWASGNQVIGWQPTSTTYPPTCQWLPYSIMIWGTGYSTNQWVCPYSHGLWELSSLKSGATWNGKENGTDWEATEGLQDVHSPPGAPTTHTSYAMWVY
jgi:hypothetical protein